MAQKRGKMDIYRNKIPLFGSFLGFDFISDSNPVINV
jgi:hypothetical protein